MERKTSRSVRERDSWLDYLNDEDAAFLKRFVLVSGSLKELAAAYGVTYPTIRLRVDRLIQKIEVVDHVEFGDGFEKHLRGLLAEGKLDNGTFKEIAAAYRQSKEAHE